jgi:hypothetical protein
METYIYSIDPSDLRKMNNKGRMIQYTDRFDTSFVAPYPPPQLRLPAANPNTVYPSPMVRSSPGHRLYMGLMTDYTYNFCSIVQIFGIEDLAL